MLFFASSLWAKPVSQQVLDQIARHFFGCAVTSHPLGDEMCLYSPVEGHGFLLMATDDCVRPVLAYSYESSFDADCMPAHVAAWIDGYRREIAAAVAAGITPSPEVRAMWENPFPGKSGNSVAPLLTTRWSQRPYYNNLCPYDSNDSTNAVAGCVATAMAQIMKYWEWPVVGWNSHTYVHGLYGTLSADFGNTVYRWDRMPDTLSALCDSLEVDAVATVTYHAGVAVEMRYGTSASGAATVARGGFEYPSAENALKTYFRYNPMLHGIDKAAYSDAEWDALLRSELDAARPVLYSAYDINAGGHAFVLDGYDTLGMFHINWGWGGYYNAYYTVDSLSPGAGSMGGDAVYTFNFNNAAIIDIYPFATTVDTVVNVDIVSANPDWGSVDGSGVYHPYDTVVIIPQAAEGFRYQRMASGRLNIPLSFLAVNNVTDTVYFERIEGDTIGYCSDNNVSSWRDDYGATTEWGIRIPPVMRKARQLTAVQLYVYMGATFTMNIYVGDSINDAMPIYTGQYYFTDDETGWNTLQLDSVLTFHRTQTIWITFSVTDGESIYPASCSSFCGNSDGSWYHLPDGWHPYDQQGVYYTWMIRGVFLPREWYNVAVSPNDINFGDIMGMGHYAPGDVVTLHALPHNGYQFSNWSNGSNDNPMSFVVTCDTTFIAFFEPIIGIDDIDDSGLHVSIQGLTMTVENPAGEPVDLYDVQGRCLASSRLSSFSHRFSSPGVYLLKMEGYRARKLVIMR